MTGNSNHRKIGEILRKSNRAILSIIAIILVIVLVALTWSTIGLWRDLNKPVEAKTPWNEHYQAKEFPGRNAMVELIEGAPNGIDPASWKPAAEGRNDLNLTVLPKTCTQLPPSNARITYRTGQGDGLNTMVMVYGAGQARTQYDTYTKQLSSCGTNYQQADNISTADGVVLMTRGDMIISLTSNDQGKLDKAKDWYATQLESVLDKTSCVVKDETATDANRSFYYDPDKYVGLTKTETVKVNDMILQVSVPQVLRDHNMDVNQAFVDPAKATDAPEVPLSPLPKGMESKVPTAPAIPTVEPAPKAPSSSKQVSYQIMDEYGPGCGWAWSGQKAPRYDEQVIAANKATTLKNARIDLQNGIKTYNRQAVDWSHSTTLLMSFQSTWDAYVKKTNGIFDSWRKLNDARTALQPAWFAYVDSANEWLHWDENVDKARTDYESALKSCQDASSMDYKTRLDDWNRRKADLQKKLDDLDRTIQSLTGSTSTSNDPNEEEPSGDASQKPMDDAGKATLDKALKDRDDVIRQLNELGSTPTKPSASETQASCESSVGKPEILSRTKPDKPVPPVIPKDVTIPSSWPTDPLAGN